MKVNKLLTLRLAFLLLLVLTGSFTTSAQNESWRTITPGDLAMKPTVEPDADAEAIFWEVRLDNKKGSRLAYENYVRVKIFTERGRERFSKFDITFYKGRKVEDVAARVIKPDGSIINLNPADIFDREIVRRGKIKVQAKSFAVPGIEPGVILEYRYREIIKNETASGERLMFQRDIPIQRMTYYVRPYPGITMRHQRFNMPSDIGFTKEADDFYSMTMRNVPAFKEEPQMPPEDLLKSWALISYSNFFNGDSWRDLANAYSFGYKELVKPNDEVKITATQITFDAKNQDEKLRKIYNFVQKQIKNAVFDRSITPEQFEKIKNKKPGDTLKNRIGTSADIELLFAAMANAVGFEAQIVLSGDRREFFFDPNQQNHRSFVHNCCIAVSIDDKWKYFNPSTPYLGYGDLAWYEEDVAAILIGDGNFINWKTPLSGHEKNLAKRTGKFKLLEDGTLEGDVRIEYSGQRAITRRGEGFSDSATKREEDLKTQIKEQLRNAEISELRMENFDDNSKPLIHLYKLKIPNYAQKTGKRLFVQPNVFEFGAEPKFSATTRVHPIYFSYPYSDDDTIEIMFPAGFSLESPDSPGKIADALNITSLDINMFISKEKDKVTYKRKFHFGGGGNIVLPKEAYTPLKNLFDAFYKADMHTLTLRQDTTTAK